MVNSGPRRWFQFRLRTLLIGVLLLSIALSCFAVRMKRASRQKEAVEIIERLGGSVCYDSREFSAHSHGPQWLKRVLGADFCDDVELVSLLGTQANDADLESVRWLPALKAVYSDSNQISDDALLYLRDLRCLEILCLDRARITDTGIEYLAESSNLCALHLAETRVTDIGLAHLENLTNLTSLCLADTGITDDGLQHLQTLSTLEVLNLTGTQITDAGLMCLTGLSGLTTLDVVETQVTPEGVKKFQQARPNCHVFYGPF